MARPLVGRYRASWLQGRDMIVEFSCVEAWSDWMASKTHGDIE